MTTLFDQLLGSWELVEYTQILDTGPAHHPLGDDAVGSIIYTPERRMAVNIMRPGRANWALPNPGVGTPAETAAAAAGYIAYAGSFTVDEADSVVEHHVEVSLFPNWIGVVQKRFVDLRGDELVLEAPPLADAAGNRATPRLRWRRFR
jgi:hypothetical protein